MSETAVRVDLRQANLSESAELNEAGDHVFLVIDQPPPVRSLLRLTVGEEQKAFEVGRVVEVVSEDEPARGCYGSFVELDRLEEQEKVGSEHLQPGIGGGGGVPAPVVIMNTADMMLGEAGSEEAEAEAAAASDAESSDAESGDAESSDADTESGDTDAESSDADAESNDAESGDADADAESSDDD